MSEIVYFDNNASTRLDETVLEAMLPALRHAGNAASGHAPGDWARSAVETAREQVAELLAANRNEIIFTSGSTEANNLAIKGVASQATDRTEIVSCVTEHPAVLGPLENLKKQGHPVTLVRVGADGLVDLAELEDAVTERTLLVTVMAVNNETGVVAPMAEVVRIAHAQGALVHTDATQAMAWGGFDTTAIPVDLLSLSSHKFHGPQGSGALFVRRQTQAALRPIAEGGGHERGLRSGTLNTAGIVGLGAAAELAKRHGLEAAETVRSRRNVLHQLLLEDLSAVGLALNGHLTERAPGTLNVSVPGMEADAVIAATPSVAMSTGSACSTGVPGPSHVLTAMGLSTLRAEGSLRLSLSRYTTDDEIEVGARAIITGVGRVLGRTNLVGAR
ncbi:cysteine desulfurase family protein [Kribbella sp. NPDC051620]|uniref:cysteine desulfurase family protein n=1 Tax=Kribbella sp. NPDC051620 TaxID=3364120 RepID=UPI003790C870